MFHKISNHYLVSSAKKSQSKQKVKSHIQQVKR